MDERTARHILWLIQNGCTIKPSRYAKYCRPIKMHKTHVTLTFDYDLEIQ